MEGWLLKVAQYFEYHEAPANVKITFGICTLDSKELQRYKWLKKTNCHQRCRGQNGESYVEYCEDIERQSNFSEEFSERLSCGEFLR